MVTKGSRVVSSSAEEADKPRRREVDELSRVAVLAAFQPFEYGAERLPPRSFVLLEGPRLPGQPGNAPREPRPTLRRENAPAEEAVRTLEPRVFSSALEQLLQRRVQRLRLLQGEKDLCRKTVG